jgi:phage terminase large subunit-like protein
MKDLESVVADGRFHHDVNQVLTFCVSNLLVHETSAGNYTMPAKSRPENKIDCAVALLLAMNRALSCDGIAEKPDYGFMFL